jgi:hypothetical protein
LKKIRIIVGINANALNANWYKAAKEKRGVYAEAADPVDDGVGAAAEGGE